MPLNMTPVEIAADRQRVLPAAAARALRQGKLAKNKPVT
jgi:hypothetical protein